jgi:hypothetical protein
VKKEFGQQFIDWLISPRTVRYRRLQIGGEQLFYRTPTGGA